MEVFILNGRKMELIAKGAEANLYLDGKLLVKHRIKKEYRIRELDERLRKSRTRHEAKLLENAKGLIPVPSVYEVDLKENRIVMEFINGITVKDVIESGKDIQLGDICKKIGIYISRLHDMNLVHGDLTTSNMIIRGLCPRNSETESRILKDNEVYFIDFGLGTTSTRIEDKAMDMVVLKKSLMATHTGKFEIIWNGIMGGYRNSKNFDEISKRIGIIEKRVRYA